MFCMENTLSSPIESHLENPIMEKPINPQVNNRKVPRSLIYILLLLLFLLMGIFSYLLLTGRISFVETNVNDNNANEEVSENDDSDETNLLTYTYNNPKMVYGFSLEYPQGWEITKEETTCGINPVTSTEICTNFELVLSLIENPEYSFSLDMCSECSPGFICTFSDSEFDQEFLDAMQGGVDFEEFENFDGENYRRGQKTAEDTTNLTICKLVKSEGNPDFYSSSILPAIDSISYGLDKDVDEKILKEMDNIVLSLRSVLPSNSDSTEFKYEYEVEVVEYEPDSSYVGFEICDNSLSTCTVYGVKASEIAKATLGEKFVLSFNEMGETRAAAGTTYIKIMGEFELVSVE